MAHIVKTVRTAWPVDVAFSYMADLSHAAEWDPSVVGASRDDTGPIGVGSAFELVVRVGGRRVPLRYEVSELAHGRVTFVARSETLVSCDTVTVARRDGITEVVYDARIRFRGLFRIGDPVLSLGFRGVATRAIRGLEQRLSRAA